MSNYKVLTEYVGGGEIQKRVHMNFVREMFGCSTSETKELSFEERCEMAKQQLLKNFYSGQLQIHFADEIQEKNTPVRYILNVEATQYPVGKTEKTLSKIELQNATYHHLLNDTTQDGEHNISVIVTSCNLAETKQWKIRVCDKFAHTQKYINICVLSSKTRSTKGGSGKTIANFTHALAVLPDKDLPNILVMCCHAKRVKEDCIDLLKSCRRIRPNNENSVGNIRKDKKFTYNFFFDEADRAQNLTLSTAFINKYKEEDLVKHVRQVQFITATPTTQFFRKLNEKCGIPILENADKGLDLIDRRQANIDYQSILTQDVITLSGPVAPLEYIKHGIENKTNNEVINMNMRNIIFAPAERICISHNKMIDYFIDNYGYWGLIHNGTNKAFITPAKEFISIDNFNKRYNVKGELYNTLSKWNELYPTYSLVISGLTTIIRGITWNTKGFNFTHMFVSTYHAKIESELIQLFGRACGNKKYCGKIKIISPPYATIQAKRFVKNLLTIKDQELEAYDENSFETKRANMNIITFESKEYDEIYIYVKKTQILARCRPAKTSIKIEKTDNGFYKSIIRGEPRVRSYNEIMEQKGSGINGKNKYRINASYRDIKNKDTLVWVVCHKNKY